MSCLVSFEQVTLRDVRQSFVLSLFFSFFVSVCPLFIKDQRERERENDHSPTRKNLRGLSGLTEEGQRSKNKKQNREKKQKETKAREEK